LQYNRARWFDPAVGRWISEDPIGFKAGDTNISRYVGNDPIHWIDPSGLWKITRDPAETKALAVSEKGDTVQKLADKVGLDAGSWKAWLRTAESNTLDDFRVVHNGHIVLGSTWVTPDEDICPGQKFTVPNLIYTVWAGEYSTEGKWLSGFDADVEYLRARGFQVYDPNLLSKDPVWGILPAKVLEEIRFHSQMGELHGLLMAGHGGASGIGTGKVNPVDPGGKQLKHDHLSLDYGAIGNNLKYKLGFVLVNACQAGLNAGRLASPTGIFSGPRGYCAPWPISVCADMESWTAAEDILKPGVQGTKK
jgi:hypothetical protein